MHPMLFDLIAVCAKHQVTHVVLAGGLPPKGSLEAIKETGAKVICFAPALSLAKKLIRSGVDALVVEGMEAGGHIGPVSTSVLAQEILPEVAEQVPVFVAGGIGRGEAIARYLDMGAAGVQLGTRFVCATESIAHRQFQEGVLPRLRARRGASVQIDPRLPVIPVRALKNAGGELFTAKQREVAQLLDEGKVEMMEAQLQIEHYWAGALRRAVIDGDVEHGSADGRPVGRHGDQGRARRRDHRAVDGRSRARAGEARGLNGRQRDALRQPPQFLRALQHPDHADHDDRVAHAEIDAAIDLGQRGRRAASPNSRRSSDRHGRSDRAAPARRPRSRC